MRKDIGLGMSAAASWAWGTSLVVGMQIARQKGLGAWTVWAAANTLALPLFGELARRGLLGPHVFNRPWIRRFALAIQCFCLVIQMNIIFEVLEAMGLSAWGAYAAAVGTGWLFTLLMYRHGLVTSIRTDIWQWGITMAAILIIIGMGQYGNMPRPPFPESSGGDMLWSAWSACILLAGPVGDVQHWQRAGADWQGRAYLWGGLFFGLYMLLVLGMAHFAFNTAMNAVLLVAVLCVTSSTIDSIAVALHEIGGRRTGTAAALSLCIFWGVFVHMGVISLWSHAGIFRVAFALIILWLACRMRDRESEYPGINSPRPGYATGRFHAPAGGGMSIKKTIKSARKDLQPFSERANTQPRQE